MGLLAETFLKREKGARIVHDPRLTWNTLDIVAKNGGKAVLSKSGHAFIKQVMREVACNLGGKGEDWDRWCKGERVNTEMELQKISESIKSAATRSELILAFALAVDGVRQGNAHPHGAAIDWLSADWAGPIFDALDVFVPWALRELQSSSS